MSDVAAVAFDLDGVLIESEQTWDDARRAVVRETGGHWVASATRDMMGMSAPEWPRYMHDTLHVPVARRAHRGGRRVDRITCSGTCGR